MRGIVKHVFLSLTQLSNTPRMHFFFYLQSSDIGFKS